MRWIAVILFMVSVVASAQNHQNIDEKYFNGHKEKIMELLELTNQERTRLGLKTLELDSVLMKAAYLRVLEARNYFSHTRPNNKDFYSILSDRDQCVYSYNAEILAGGCKRPQDAFNGWKRSKGHYANMTNFRFTSIGLCYDSKHDTWIEFFGENKQLIY